MNKINAPMLANQRAFFDIPDDIAYFNCAARSPFLKATVSAGDAAIRHRSHPWTWAFPMVREEGERARALFAGLAGARADDIALINAVSYGIAVAARNLPLARAQTIVVVEDQFASNMYQWKVAAEETGATVRVVPRPDDGDWTSAILDNLDQDTAIAALPACHWLDGGLLDLIAIGKRCRELGAAYVIDATQWIGARPFDVGEIDPDFMVAAAYKWLLSPYTLAFLYVAPRHQDGTPLEHNTYNHPGANASIEGRLEYPMDFAEGARRFDMGEGYNVINLPMANAAMTQLHDWTPAAITRTLTPIITEVCDWAASRGFQVVPGDHRVGHFTSIRRQAGAPEGLLDALASEGVYASLRGGGLRLAPHLHVNAEDVARLLSALDKHWPK